MLLDNTSAFGSKYHDSEPSFVLCCSRVANFFLISAIVEVDCTAARVSHVDDTFAKLSKMTLVRTRMVNLSTLFISTVFHSAFCFFRFFAFLQSVFDCENCPGWDFPLVVEEKGGRSERQREKWRVEKRRKE